MKTAIVTGAGGYIGYRLCQYLSEQGVKVSAITMDRNLDLEKLKGVTVYINPEPSFLRFQKQLFQNHADVLYHLAWCGVQSDEKNSEFVQCKNIDLCLSAMQLAKEIKCERIVVPGSAAEYAYCGETITGYNVAAPGDFYAAAKAAAHILCQQYAVQNELSLNWLIVGSVYGPGREDGNLISYTIKSLLSGDVPVFTKLEQKWDYLYIQDLLQALYLVGVRGVSGKTYPIGFGEARPLYWYVKTIRDLIDPSLTMEIGKLPYKNGKCPDHSVLDIRDLQKDTGFSPQVSFIDGIAKTIEYYRTLVTRRGALQAHETLSQRHK